MEMSLLCAMIVMNHKIYMEIFKKQIYILNNFVKYPGQIWNMTDFQN